MDRSAGSGDRPGPGQFPAVRAWLHGFASHPPQGPESQTLGPYLAAARSAEKARLAAAVLTRLPSPGVLWLRG